jgi:UDP-N-acetylmuramoyl-L-alanyl-D-glutamate--2,6-diaminopimelate ligase
MQMIHLSNKPTVVIDYAHTVDALENALSALKPHCQGKIILVFGCGGDRDSGKRSEMARIAEQQADVVIVTDDNPRFESPEKIVRDIMTGFKSPENIVVEHDRKLAIQRALLQASIADLVLIAGKGHETWQEVKGEKRHFSDLEQVEMHLGVGALASRQGAIGLV